MNQYELIENYTIEQLAEMVIKLKNGKENKTMDILDMQKCQEEYEKFLKESPFQSEIEKIARDICERQDNAMAMEFTRVICNLLKENGVFVHKTEYRRMEDVSKNTIKERYGIIFDSMDFSEHDKKFTDEINRLKSELDRKETTINQIDDILNELFGVTHDIAKTDEFKKILRDKLKGNVGSEGYREKQKKTNNFYGMYANSAKNLIKDNVLMFLGILTKELVENGIDFRYDMENEMKVYDITIKDNKTIADFLPAEPIKVADMMISAEGENEKVIVEKGFPCAYRTTHNLFDISELRQIAEHLLVYCNNQKENDNE